MQSGNKPPSTLMAIRNGKMKRGPGGNSPMEAGMNAQMNNGQGHGHNFFSTTPLMGHAMSGTQLGQADGAIRNAQSTLAKFRFADGGKVAKPAGPSAKERKEIRNIIERGKTNAVAALRGTRAALIDSSPDDSSDFGPALDKLRGRLEMKDGGEVEASASGDPQMMYQEYMELMDHLQDANLDQGLQVQIVERLADLEQTLEALGINVAEQAGIG
jgi:hypothetical protein